MFKRMTESIRLFVTDVRTEMKKVSFPSRAETIGSTTVVIVFCILMSVYLSVIDSFLSWLVGKLIRISQKEGQQHFIEGLRVGHDKELVRHTYVRGF